MEEWFNKLLHKKSKSDMIMKVLCEFIYLFIHLLINWIWLFLVWKYTELTQNKTKK